MKRGVLGLVATLVLSATGAAGSLHPLRHESGADPSGDVLLLPTPEAILDACSYSAAKDDWRALCPTALPRPFVGHPPFPLPGVAVFSDPPGLEFGYSAPVEGSGDLAQSNLWHNRPCCFLHLDIQREHVYGAPDWHPTRGRRATLGGREGWLRPANSASYYGAYFSNHLRFFFTEADEHYVVTLHDFGPGTRALLDALVEELKPAKPMPEPLPPKPPTPCKQYGRSSICKRGPVADVAVAGEAVWLAKADAGSIVRVDPETDRRTVLIRASYPSLLAGARNALWAVTWKGDSTLLKVLKIDPTDGRVARTIGIGHVAPSGVALADGAIWLADWWRDRVVRVDRHTGDRSTLRTGEGARDLLAAFGSVWVSNTADGTVTRIDTRTNEVVVTLAVGEYPQALAVAGDAVWVAHTGDRTVSRIDPASNAVTATYEVGLRPIALLADGDCLLVADFVEDVVRCLDPENGHSTPLYDEIGQGPFVLRSGLGKLWLGNNAGLLSIDP